MPMILVVCPIFWSYGYPDGSRLGQELFELARQVGQVVPQHALEDVHVDPVVAVHHVLTHADDLSPLDARELQSVRDGDSRGGLANYADPAQDGIHAQVVVPPPLATLVAVEERPARALQHVLQALPGAIPHRMISTPSCSMAALTPGRAL